MNLKQISLISILTTGLSFGLNAASALPGDISGLVDSAAPAVVNITSKKEVKMRDNRRGFDEFERFFGIPRGYSQPQEPQTREAVSYGSGFIFKEGYLLTNFHNAEVRLGDTLVVIGALFWSLHIIYIGKIIETFDVPILIGLIQTSIVCIFSIIVALFFEEFILENILGQKLQILYAGSLSAGIAFVLQIYAQKNIQPTPSAIIFSLEGVVATIAAWILLSQILNINNILGCIFILAGVLFSQLVPKIKKINYK